VVAAHREADVIAAKIANARALDWPADRLEVIVACDGSPDDTPARGAGRGSRRRPRASHGAARCARRTPRSSAPAGDLLAFSDANALWEPEALRALAAPFADERVGYACGQVRFVGDGGTNQEGLYWRYEMAVRARESRLASVTAGNGAIYAVRPEAYVRVDPVMGHDLSLPFNMVKRGWRAVYAPAARATEKMVPTIEGEFARKRRMMSHAWPIVLRGGLLSPRGYPPLYALMIASHRVLRYSAPFLHAVALIANAALLGRGWVYVVTFAVQLAVIAAALAGAWSAHARCSWRAITSSRRRPCGGAVGLPAPRHAGGLGSAGRHALSGTVLSADYCQKQMPFFRHAGHRLAYKIHGEGPRTCLLVHGCWCRSACTSPCARTRAARQSAWSRSTCWATGARTARATWASTR
jgi:hypothetical protein